mmetsp:Transcript_44016/g.53233  ORF Transcript_44016/g.53233 Transcript_44016/m.53233 type:complete len:111 (+) Transcript_44016:218-550(+)
MKDNDYVETPPAAGTIEITVLLTSIVIKCHGCYDIYPRAVFDSFESCEPLIQIHTATHEHISLQTVRARDVAVSDVKSDAHFDDNTLMLKEKITELTGQRILSVMPVHCM